MISLVLGFIFFCGYSRKCSLKRPYTRPLSLWATNDVGGPIVVTVNSTREDVSRLLGKTWEQIETLIPATILEVSRKELQSAISLLVLATFKKASDSDDNSKELVQNMFFAADANGDGELTFPEWYDWLNSANATLINSDFVLPRVPAVEDHNSILYSLKQVCSHALFSLQVLSRGNSDNPNEFVSAFLAGGIMSGVLDKDVCRAMLGQLSPASRELISYSISIESASLPTALKHLSAELMRPQETEPPPAEDTDSSDNEQLIETIDLSSIPLLEAPSIFDEEDTAPSFPTLITSAVEETGLVLRSAANGNNNNKQLARFQQSMQTMDDMFQKAQVLTQEISELRGVIKDLDDSQANAMRLLILREHGKREDILRLAMTIRATRLQHASKLPQYARHQLAIDTLQLWAPLSFQLGVSSTISELEIHSYVLLFPRSFGTFIEWYGSYKPLARGLIEDFRKDIFASLKRISGASDLIRKITIQSRLKTPSSAFKKMVKGAKRHHQLLDLAGIRIIVEENPLATSADAEYEAVTLALQVVTSLSSWQEEKSRFKDYIKNPKPSGYQSIHLSLRHIEKGLNLEVQIRSRRMHNVAEYGSAAHKNYKALMLPESIDKENNLNSE